VIEAVGVPRAANARKLDSSPHALIPARPPGRHAGILQAILRSKGIDHFEERELIEIASPHRRRSPAHWCRRRALATLRGQNKLNRPMTSATTNIAPNWSARARCRALAPRPQTMLTVLTQMPAFISVNRSERLPTSAGNLDSQFNYVRPDLEKSTAASSGNLRKSYSMRGDKVSGDLVLPQRLAHDVEAARQGGIAEAAIPLPWSSAPDRGGQRFFRADELGLGLDQAEARAATDSLDRYMGGLHR
jgi:hypothetical protein